MLHIPKCWAAEEANVAQASGAQRGRSQSPLKEKKVIFAAGTKEEDGKGRLEGMIATEDRKGG